MELDFLKETTYLGNSLRQWLIALGASAAALIALEILKGMVVGRLKAIAQKTVNDWDDLFVDMARRTRFWVLAIFSFWWGAHFLQVSPAGPSPQKILGALRIIGIVAGALQIGIWGNALIEHWIEKKVSTEAEDTRAAFGALEVIGRVFLWALLLLLMFDNLGFDVGSLVAGLGIGGVAVALAVQNILGDILCSVSIMLDKPFEVGDFIVVDDKLGNVEKIGIKTTRVRSLQGEEIVFPNTDLVGSRIQNFKRMKERRIVSVLGVTYETPADKVEAIPGMIAEVFGTLDEARLDRAHFKSFGPSSLDFEVVYYVASGEYALYMDLQQKLNLALLRRFQSEGIEFAYPTQTIHLAQAAAS